MVPGEGHSVSGLQLFLRVRVEDKSIMECREPCVLVVGVSVGNSIAPFVDSECYDPFCQYHGFRPACLSA